MIWTATKTSAATPTVSLSGPAVTNELVKVPTSGFDETGFALQVGTGKREMLTPSKSNAGTDHGSPLWPRSSITRRSRLGRPLIIARWPLSLRLLPSSNWAGICGSNKSWP